MESSEKLSLSPTDLAWLAGLLEGEGCFSYRAGCTPTIRGWADQKAKVLYLHVPSGCVERAS